MTKKSINPETIKITLDQMGQTVEVMNSVINRLKVYLEDVLENKEIETREPSIDKEEEKELEQIVLSIMDKNIH